jgi:hypothetical protein
MMLVPALSSRSAVEMVTIEPADLDAAIERDASAGEADASSAMAQR